MGVAVRLTLSAGTVLGCPGGVSGCVGLSGCVALPDPVGLAAGIALTTLVALITWVVLSVWVPWSAGVVTVRVAGRTAARACWAGVGAAMFVSVAVRAS